MKTVSYADGELLSKISTAELIEVHEHNGQVGCIVLDDTIVINKNLSRRDRKNVLLDYYHDEQAAKAKRDAKRLDKYQMAEVGINC